MKALTIFKKKEDGGADTHIHGIFHGKIRAVNIPNKIRTIDKIMSSSNHIKQLPQNGIPRNSCSQTKFLH